MGNYRCSNLILLYPSHVRNERVWMRISEFHYVQHSETSFVLPVRRWFQRPVSQSHIGGMVNRRQRKFINCDIVRPIVNLWK